MGGAASSLPKPQRVNPDVEQWLRESCGPGLVSCAPALATAGYSCLSSIRKTLPHDFGVDIAKSTIPDSHKRILCAEQIKLNAADMLPLTRWLHSVSPDFDYYAEVLAELDYTTLEVVRQTRAAEFAEDVQRLSIPATHRRVLIRAHTKLVGEERTVLPMVSSLEQPRTNDKSVDQIRPSSPVRPVEAKTIDEQLGRSASPSQKSQTHSAVPRPRPPPSTLARSTAAATTVAAAVATTATAAVVAVEAVAADEKSNDHGLKRWLDANTTAVDAVGSEGCELVTRGLEEFSMETLAALGTASTFAKPVFNLLVFTYKCYQSAKVVPGYALGLKRTLHEAEAELVKAKDVFRPGPWLRSLCSTLEEARDAASAALKHANDKSAAGKLKFFLLAKKDRETLERCKRELHDVMKEADLHVQLAQGAGAAALAEREADAKLRDAVVRAAEAQGVGVLDALQGDAALRGRVEAGLGLGETLILEGIEAMKAQLAAVAEAAAERRHTLEQRLMPCDFEGEVRSKLALYCEGTREWIFDEVSRWMLGAEETQRAFVLVGDAGVGKSVVSSVLLERHSSRILGHHLCRYDSMKRSDPRKLLHTLAFQLSERMPGYAELLAKVPEMAGTAAEVQQNLERLNVPDLFEALLRKPLSKIAAPDDPPGRRVLLIDALDECASELGRNALLDVVVGQFDALPKWLGLVLTTRPESDILAALSARFELQTLTTENANSRRDVELFMRMLLRGRVEPASDLERGVELVVDKSEGLLLYAHYIQQTRLKDGAAMFTLAELANFPSGLGGVYKSNFERLLAAMAREEQYDTLLSAVVAARQPLLHSFVVDLFDGNRRVANQILQRASLVLRVRAEAGSSASKTVSLFHKSVKDWLVGELKGCSTPERLVVDDAKGNAMLGALCRADLGAGGASRPAAIVAESDPRLAYSTRFVVLHFVSAARGVSGGARRAELVGAACEYGLSGAWARRRFESGGVSLGEVIGDAEAVLGAVASFGGGEEEASAATGLVEFLATLPPSRAGHTALHVAAATGCHRVVRVILDESGREGTLEPNALTRAKESALMVAAKAGQAAVALTLLEHAAFTAEREESVGPSGEMLSCTSWACFFGHVDVVAALADHASTAYQLNLVDDIGSTVLILAAISGQSEVVAFLLAHEGVSDATINTVGKPGYTALTQVLHLAACSVPRCPMIGSKVSFWNPDAPDALHRICAALLASPRFTAVDVRFKGKTSLKYAQESGCPDAVCRLLGETEVETAARTGDLKHLRSFLDAADPHDAVFGVDSPLLSLAASGGHVACCELLFERLPPAAINAAPAGASALHVAARAGRADALRRLLESGRFEPSTINLNGKSGTVLRVCGAEPCEVRARSD